MALSDHFPPITLFFGTPCTLQGLVHCLPWLPAAAQHEGGGQVNQHGGLQLHRDLLRLRDEDRHQEPVQRESEEYTSEE